MEDDVLSFRTKKKKPIPFDFVLDLLAELEPHTRPMFGCTSIYVGEKIVLILRQKNKPDRDDGIWVATTKEHRKSLRQDLPILRDISMFGPGPTSWQNLPSEDADFEQAANQVCEMILKGDPRIGKIPERKKSKSKAKAKPKKRR